MINLLELRQMISAFYSKYSAWINIILKGIMSLCLYFFIHSQLNFTNKLGNPFLILLLAVVSSVFPVKIICLFVVFFILAQISGISLLFAGITGVVLLMLLLIYFHLSIGKEVFLLLTPIAFFLHIPYVIPVAAALTGSPVDILGIAVGTIIYFLIIYIKLFIQPISTIGSKDMGKVINTVSDTVNDIAKRPAILLYLAIFTATLLLVYFLRKLSVNYSWAIAIIAGNLFMLITFLLFDYKLDIPVSPFEIIFGTLASLLVNFIVMFFKFNLDYTSTEYLQFEDDSYYYYVKAVPKIVIAERDRRIHRITDKDSKSYKTDDINLENRNR